MDLPDKPLILLSDQTEGFNTNCTATPVLEVLRQPLEEGVVTITRMLVGIMLIPRPTFFRP
jgi:predicted ATPase with chaperone activity